MVHRNDVVAVVGRLGLAPLFLMSGISKLAAPEATIGYIQAAGLPVPPLALWGAIAVELGVGMAMLIGFKTRLAAIILAVFSLVTAFFFHAQFADQNQFIHFLKNIAIAGGLLQLAAFGGGSISLDACARRPAEPSRDAPAA